MSLLEITSLLFTNAATDYWLIFLVIIFALILGSFLSMLTARLPSLDNSSFITTIIALSVKSSYCDNCKRSLKWFNLIPLLSWVVQKGKCSYCQYPISWRYPLIELTTIIYTVSIVISFANEPWQLGLAWLIFGMFIVSIAVIDMEQLIILDRLSLTLLWMGLLININQLTTSTTESILGAACGYVSFWIIYQIHFFITKQEGLGYGDFKLLAALGAWLGLSNLPVLVTLSASIALIYALIIWFFKRAKTTSTPLEPCSIRGNDFTLKNFAQTSIPFGPFLCLSSWLVIIL